MDSSSTFDIFVFEKSVGRVMEYSILNFMLNGNGCIMYLISQLNSVFYIVTSSA